MRRRQYLGAIGGAISVSGGAGRSSNGIRTDSAAPEALSGQVRRIDGSSTRAQVSLYTEKDGEVELLDQTASDTNGQFDLRAVPPDEARLIARADDWFTTREVVSGTFDETYSLKLDHQLLFGPKTATDEWGRAVGTVSTFRRISPADPNQQVLFLDLTSPGTDTETDFTHLEGALLSLTLPESVTVGYQQGTVSACRTDNRPPQCWSLPFEIQDSEQIHSWHPKKSPKLPPFTLTGSRYRAAFDVEQEERRLATHSIGFLKSVATGIATGGASTVLEAVQVISPQQDPDATLGNLDDLSRLSPNEYDAVEHGWIPPSVIDVAGLTFQIPILIPSENLDTDKLTATVATRWTVKYLNSIGPIILPGSTEYIGQYGDKFTIDVPDKGRSWSQTQVLTPSEQRPKEVFGTSISPTDRKVLIGSQPEAGTEIPGSAYVFEFEESDWSLKTRLTSEDVQSGSSFGWSVAFDGSTALVSDPKDPEQGTEAGALYRFDREQSRWSEGQKLLPGSLPEGANFGQSIDLSESRTLVGAPGASDTGSAYLFGLTPDGWQQRKRFIPERSGVNEFSSSVALDGEHAVVWTPSFDGSSERRGAMYIFEEQGGDWTDRTQFVTDEMPTTAVSKSALGLDDDRAILAFEQGPDPGTSPTAVYLFERDSGRWSPQDRFSISNESDTIVGVSAAINGSWAVVGTTGFGENGEGAAHFFHRDGSGWSESLSISPDSASNFFGYVVALQDGSALITDPNSVHVFRRD